MRNRNNTIESLLESLDFENCTDYEFYFSQLSLKNSTDNLLTVRLKIHLITTWLNDWVLKQ